MSDKLNIKVNIDMSQIDKDLFQIKNKISSTKINLNGKNINDQVKDLNKSFGLLNQSLTSATGKFATWFGISTMVVSFIHGIQDSVSWVYQLDQSVTTMNLTMDGSKKLFGDLVDATTSFAKSLGSTVDAGLEAVKIYTNMNESLDSLLTKSKAAIVLDNLGGSSLNVEQAADSIQALQNQFNLLDSDAMRIADTLTYVSANLKLDFARGINEITRAIQASGSIAFEAGMSLEQYSSIIGKVIERTRLSGSTVGAGFKTIFSRIFRVSDLEGEEISKIEKAFRSVSIEIRKSEKDFNDMQDVIDQLNAKWSTLSDTQKSFIAENAAGVRQKSIFINMMNAWSESVDLFNNTLDQSGFAMDRNSIFVESMAGKLNLLKATWQESVQNTINSEDLKNIIDGFTFLVGITGKTISTIGVFGTTLGVVAGTMTMFNKSLSLNFINLEKLYIQWDLLNQKAMYTNGVFSGMPSILTRTMNGFSALASGINLSKIAMIGLNTAMFAGIGYLISEGIQLLNEYKKSEENRRQAIIDSAREIEQQYKEVSKIDELLKKKKELENQEIQSIKTKEELISVEKEIARVLPETVTGFDAENIAISENTDIIEKNNNAKREQLRIRAEETIALAGGTIEDETQELNKLYDQRKKYLDLIDESRDRLNKTEDEKWRKGEQSRLEACGKGLVETNKKIVELESVVNNFQKAQKILGEITEDNTQKTKNNTEVQSKNSEISKHSTDIIVDYAKALKDSSEAFDDITSKIQIYYKYLNELNSAEGLSASSKQEIISKYQELLPYISNEQELRKQLINVIQNEEKAQKDAYVNMLMYSEDFFNAKIKGNKDLVDKLGEYYSKDLENSKTLAQAKEKVETQLIKSLSEKWGKYFNVVNGTFNTMSTDNLVRGAMMGDKNASSMLAAIEQDKKRIAEVENRFKNLAIDIGGIDFKGINVSGIRSSSSKSKDEYLSNVEPRYRAIEKAISDLNDEIEKNNILMQVSNDQDKITFLQKQSELTTQLKQRLHELNEERRKERDEVTGRLSNLGFDIDTSGYIYTINNIEKIKSLHGDTAKSADELIKKFDSLNSAINGTGKEWNNLTRNIEDYQTQINDLNYQQYIKNYEDLNYQISVQNKLYEQANDSDKIQHLQNMNNLIKQQILVLEQLNSSRLAEMAMLDSTSLRYQQLNKDMQDTYLNILNLYSSLSSNESSYDSLRKKQLDAQADVERKLVEIIKQRINDELNALKNNYDKRKKILDDNYKYESNRLKELHDERIKSYKDDLDAYEKYINDKLDLLTGEWEEEDFLKQLNNERQIANDIQRQIDQLSLDDSLEARNKVTELTQQLADQEEKINKLKVDKERNDTKKSLQNQLSDYKEAMQAKIDLENETYEKKKQIMDEEYEYQKTRLEEEYEYRKSVLERQLENDRLFAEAQKTLANSTFEEIIKMYEEFEDKFGQGMSVLGDIIKKEFIDKLLLAQSTLASMSSSVGGYSSGGSSGSSKDSWDNISYNPDGTTTYTKGGTSVTGTSVKDAGGWDAFDKMIEKDLKGYSSGGKVDYTGLAKLHGSKSEPEYVFNYDQFKDLAKWVANYTPVIPKINIPKLSTATAGITLSVGNLINVEGSLDKNNLGDVKAAGNNILTNLRRTLERHGMV